MDRNTEIRGNKVILKPMTVAQMDTFFQWATKSPATPFWYENGKVPTREEFFLDWKLHYFNDSQPKQGRCFNIIKNARAIGEVNYNEINSEDSSVELDIIIAEDEDKNCGYGSDALKTLAEYLFCKMNVHRCYIEAVTNNIRAIKAYEKAGFKITSTFVSNGAECYHLELRKGQDR